MQYNIRRSTPVLISPQTLATEFPLISPALHTITAARQTANDIMQGVDKRLLVIVGPCSIHDPVAAFEYATLLKNAAQQFSDDLFIVMRTYFEKPRTNLGWKGFLNDPFLDNSFDFVSGLRLARKLLLDLAQLTIPTATEFLDLTTPPFLEDLISWSTIGARTAASQPHRELASGLPMPVGFKNNMQGNINVALDAIYTASHAHHFLSINQQGILSVIETKGNKNCYLILRGSDNETNYTEAYIAKAKIESVSYTHLTLPTILRV